MKCAFTLGYSNMFYPKSYYSIHEPNYGWNCQFNFAENDLIEFDGKHWCPFHLPLQNDSGIFSPKKNWGSSTKYNFLLTKFIHERVRKNVPIDLCGLVHWDRFSIATKHMQDGDVSEIPENSLIPPLSIDGAIFPRGVSLNYVFSRFFAHNVYYGGQADFSNANFVGEAKFTGSIFKDDASFINAKFENCAKFSGARFHKSMFFNFTKFKGNANFSLNDIYSLSPVIKVRSNEESIAICHFCEARFEKEAIFNDRVFLSGPNFERAYFQIAPEFHNAKFHQSVNFDGAKFPDTSSSGASHAYRTLKLAMESFSARDEQAMFFALEQRSKAKKISTPKSIRLFSYLYDWLSCSGENFVRPLLWLAALTVCFGIGYRYSLSYAVLNHEFSVSFIFNFTLEQVIRPFGIWAPEYLTKAEIVPKDYRVGFSELMLKIAATIQALCSIGLLTLSLLSLRRRFKLD